MPKLSLSLALLAAAVAVPAGLRADTYNFSISTSAANNDPAYSFTASGTITGPVDPYNNTAFDIQLISTNQSIVGYDFTGVVSPGVADSAHPTSANGYTFNNVLYTAAGAPHVDANGFLLELTIPGGPPGISLAHVFYNTPSASDPINGYEVDLVDPNDPSATTPFSIDSFTVEPVSPVPEPSTLALLGTGLAGAAGLLRKRLAR